KPDRDGLVPRLGSPAWTLRPLLLKFVRLRHAGQRLHYALAWEGDDDLRSVAELALQLEGAVMQFGETFGDGKTEPGAAFRRLMRQRALAKALQHAWDFVLGNTGTGVLDAQELAAD